jgi:hypothetical protein
MHASGQQQPMHVWAQARKPPLMAAGRMEPRMVMHHLLLHADSAQPEGGYAR